MARVSVPLWGVTLSRPLPVIALVGFYPTNKLIGIRPLPWRTVTCFTPNKSGTIQYYPSFRKAILDLGVRSLLLLTRLPLAPILRSGPARLACLRHTASVHPEPGSNSQKKLTNVSLRNKSHQKFLPP